MTAYETEKPKTDAAMGQKPRVWGVVILGIIRGVFTTIIVLNSFQEVQSLGSNADLLPGWYVPFQYGVLGLAAFSLLSAIFLIMYKRWGLYLGMVAFGGDILFGILGILLAGGIAGFPILAFILDVIVVRYIYKWMTSHPETTYFT